MVYGISTVCYMVEYISMVFLLNGIPMVEDISVVAMVDDDFMVYLWWLCDSMVALK